VTRLPGARGSRKAKHKRQHGNAQKTPLLAMAHASSYPLNSRFIPDPIAPRMSQNMPPLQHLNARTPAQAYARDVKSELFFQGKKTMRIPVTHALRAFRRPRKPAPNLWAPSRSPSISGRGSSGRSRACAPPPTSARDNGQARILSHPPPIDRAGARGLLRRGAEGRWDRAPPPGRTLCRGAPDSR